MKLPVAGPTYNFENRSFDAQRCINWFTIVSESGTSKEPAALLGTPGKDLFGTVGGGPHRGSLSLDDLTRAFSVSGNQFFEVFDDGTSTLRGTLNTTTGRVGMAQNRTQVVIVDGPNGYIFTLASNSFGVITDPDFLGSNTVSYVDGYFLFCEPDTDNFYISTIADGADYDALDFTVAESSPDRLVSVIAINGDAWLFGQRTVEVFQNTGNVVFPFERIGGAVMQIGCAAPHTVVPFDNTVVWLGIDANGSGIVWRATDYSNAQKISTRSIEARIAQITDLSESYSWVYHEQGHLFYALNIKSLDTTLVYDATTGMWHERAYWNPILSTYEQDRVSTRFYFAGKNLVGDRENGNIYEMSLSLVSDNGQEIVRKRIFPHIQDEKKRMSHSVLELDMEAGVGNNTGEGSDPIVTLRYSNDGGYTWSGSRTAKVGKIGEYGKRIRFHRLGSARDRVYEITFTEKCRAQINGAYLNAA